MRIHEPDHFITRAWECVGGDKVVPSRVGEGIYYVHLFNLKLPFFDHFIKPLYQSAISHVREVPE